MMSRGVKLGKSTKHNIYIADAYRSTSSFVPDTSRGEEIAGSLVISLTEGIQQTDHTRTGHTSSVYDCL